MIGLAVVSAGKIRFDLAIFMHIRASPDGPRTRQTSGSALSTDAPGAIWSKSGKEKTTSTVRCEAAPVRLTACSRCPTHCQPKDRSDSTSARPDGAVTSSSKSAS